MLEKIIESRESGLNAGIVPDLTFIVQGDIKINPEKNSFSPEIKIL
jgi:hypothetical protein